MTEHTPGEGGPDRVAADFLISLSVGKDSPGAVAPTTLLAVSRGVLAALGFPDWIDATRVTQLTLTRGYVTADWQDDLGGSHHFTRAVAP
jgi:hypothetical protein